MPVRVRGLVQGDLPHSRSISFELNSLGHNQVGVNEVLENAFVDGSEGAVTWAGGLTPPGGLGENGVVTDDKDGGRKAFLQLAHNSAPFAFPQLELVGRDVYHVGFCCLLVLHLFDFGNMHVLEVLNQSSSFMLSRVTIVSLLSKR